MKLVVIANGDRVQVIDLATGEAVENLVGASIEASEDGVRATMAWHVVGTFSGESPSAGPSGPDGPRLLGRAAFIGDAPATLPHPGRVDDDDDRPRPRRAL